MATERPTKSPLGDRDSLRELGDSGFFLSPLRDMHLGDSPRRFRDDTETDASSDS